MDLQDVDSWLVAFVKRGRDHWIDWFLPSGFRHVFAFGYVPEADVWLLYDVQFARTQVKVIPDELVGSHIEYAWEEGALIKVPHIKAAAPPLLRWGFWCVPAIKHLIGVRSSALTPKGLYDHLVKIGCEQITREENKDQDNGITETECSKGEQGVKGSA